MLLRLLKEADWRMEPELTTLEPESEASQFYSNF